MKIRPIIFLSILLTVSSCTIEKQLYSKGFHVEFRKRLSEPHPREVNSIQPLTEIPRTEQVAFNPNAVTDTLIPLITEEEVSVNPSTKEIAETLLVSGKSERKPIINSTRTKVGTRTHFSESVISKALKVNGAKQQTKKTRYFDWEEFWKWVLIAGIVLGVVILGSFIPGVTFLQSLVAVLVVILALYLFVLLLSLAFGNFEWFWSGR